MVRYDQQNVKDVLFAVLSVFKGTKSDDRLTRLIQPMQKATL